MKYLPLFLLLTACQIEHKVDIPDIPEVEIQPIVVYLCISGWLYDSDGNAVVNLSGEQSTCSEAY